MNIEKVRLNLHRFDGGEGGASDSGTANVEGNQVEDSNSGEPQEVVYGKQPEKGSEGSKDGEDKSGDDLNARFDELIKGEFKDVYSQRISDTINQRFKNQNDFQQELESYDEALMPLYEHYGVEVGDFETLNEAMLDDDSLFEEEAEERGLSVDELKNIKQLEIENARLQAVAESQEREQAVQEELQRWNDEASKLQESFPGFNLESEIQNEDFANLISGGWSVEKAYKAVHADELISQAVNITANRTRQNTINSIRARGMRPAENGINSRAGVIIKDDPSKYTDDDIKEILRRVDSGEKIRL
jgi:hypothetical protein